MDSTHINNAAPLQKFKEKQQLQNSKRWASLVVAAHVSHILLSDILALVFSHFCVCLFHSAWYIYIFITRALSNQIKLFSFYWHTRPPTPHTHTQKNIYSSRIYIYALLLLYCSLFSPHTHTQTHTLEKQTDPNSSCVEREMVNER